MSMTALASRPSSMRPAMSSPRRYVVRMTAFVIIVAIVAALLAPGVSSAFMSNPALNGVILAATLFGIVFCFRAVLNLEPDIRWIEAHLAQRVNGGRMAAVQPRLLAPVARVIAEQQGELSLSPLAMRSLLDAIGARLSESREISRYLIGLLIFLGLLGTFWGLLETVRSASGVIAGLNMESADPSAAFATLKHGLEAPLQGMGTAFSASLFGLAGSLSLGFLELQASQAQNRFYNELEDWLSANTRLSGGPQGSGLQVEAGEPVFPAYIESVVAQTAENLDALRRLTVQAEEDRRGQGGALGAVATQLAAIDDHLQGQQALMARLAEGEQATAAVLTRLATALESDRFGMDEPTRQHIRSLDTTMRRMIEEMSTGRIQLSGEIRGEIKLLARTIAALAEGPEAR
ncbi:flagellar motor protein MotA [Inquilinus limosus]|uniref:Flagellar motor protein MotA n=1 Tax=Inquilinus limosus TaxID=171674 RepID=A0A211ZJ35_9PROT|nr:flagellar motor protein MotA [Inquilinus limosus]OWJ65206.1 flagellar motor protein MotA [Inquilinus limosus]